jgi:hypothetical protein
MVWSKAKPPNLMMLWSKTKLPKPYVTVIASSTELNAMKWNEAHSPVLWSGTKLRVICYMKWNEAESHNMLWSGTKLRFICFEVGLKLRVICYEVERSWESYVWSGTKLRVMLWSVTRLRAICYEVERSWEPYAMKWNEAESHMLPVHEVQWSWESYVMKWNEAESHMLPVHEVEWSWESYVMKWNEAESLMLWSGTKLRARPSWPPEPPIGRGSCPTSRPNKVSWAGKWRGSCVLQSR